MCGHGCEVAPEVKRARDFEERPEGRYNRTGKGKEKGCILRTTYPYYLVAKEKKELEAKSCDGSLQILPRYDIQPEIYSTKAQSKKSSQDKVKVMCNLYLGLSRRGRGGF